MAYEYDDEEEGGSNSAFVRKAKQPPLKAAMGKRVRTDSFDDVFADAMEQFQAKPLYQEYQDFDLSPNVKMPQMRGPGEKPSRREAFDWLGESGNNPKGRNLLGLGKKQQNAAIDLPGVTPLFDFLNVYKNKRGGWK